MCKCKRIGADWVGLLSFLCLLRVSVVLAPGAPGADLGVIDTVLNLPPRQPVEGPHPVRPLPFTPGSIHPFSAEQDVVHHDRRYANYVSRWNQAEADLRAATTSEEYAHALVRLPILAQEVGLHELFWWPMAPGDASEELGVPQRFAPPSELLSQPQEDGWLLCVFDPEDAEQRWVRQPGLALRGAWACPPLVAVDLYNHARWVDFPGDPAGFCDAVWRNLRAERLNARAQWIGGLLSQAAPDVRALGPTAPGFSSPEIATRNAVVLSRVTLDLRTASPEIGTAELAGTVSGLFGVSLSVEDLARWLAWAPDIAVLAWDPQSATPLLMSVERPDSGAPWGAIPLVAIPRRARPEDAAGAREALRRFPWRQMRGRIEPLRAAGAGADLP
jgi:superoxide dismutase